MSKQKQPGEDRVYAAPRDMIVDFEFDERVAHVFSDMVRRSVPAYHTILTMTGLLAEQYAQADSYCYDLGCSLGAVTLAMRSRISQTGVIIVGVDNSQAMIQKCREHIARYDQDQAQENRENTQVQLLCADIESVPIDNASVVVLNLTLQFIPPQRRLQILKKIHTGLRPGGIVVITEKVVFTQTEEQQFQEQMHIAFKKANAYSDLEISQKRQALENVLVPESLDVHQQRLKDAGFHQAYVCCQCFNFATIVGIKSSAGIKSSV
ncbi:MAG: carboxy-S-adenosyl-L-methionine synthase CmoA [Gammaproteobacteria bacterium]|nr:carboxy-S-adenosyl-L-methionine synthase CmoA [Gammaproteobacteria bacterium]MDH5802720.1 carboxy-S-adenosyl-L-methionine synthase CmoA [Gammaproteobacteria bacterium]